MRKQKFSVSRPGVKTLLDGRWVDGTPIVFAIRGNAQTLTGDDLAHIPAGDRERERLALTTKTKLINNDMVTETATGIKYKVENAGDWSKQGMTKATQHYRIIIVLIESEDQ